jgi:hypothetical protein
LVRAFPDDPRHERLRELVRLSRAGRVVMEDPFRVFLPALLSAVTYIVVAYDILPVCSCPDS